MVFPQATGRWYIWASLLFIVILGFSLRVPCIAHHLPGYAHIEENRVIGVVTHLKANHLNPQNFGYPALLFYLLLPILDFFNSLLPGVLGGLFGLDRFSADILLGRTVTVALSTVHVAVVFVIGKKLCDYRAGLIAALFLALNPLHASLSCFVRPDALLVLLISVAFLSAIALCHKERVGYRDYAFLGFLIGLAAAAKYNGVTAIAFIFIVHAVRRKEGPRFLASHALLALSSAAAAFFALNPFLLLDRAQGVRDILFMLRPEMNGFAFTPLENGRGWLKYPLALYESLGPGVFIVLACALLFFFRRRPQRDSMLLSFPAAYYLIMGAFNNSPARHLLPVVPFLLVFAAKFLVESADGLRHAGPGRKTTVWLPAALSVVFALPSFFSILHYNAWMNQADTRSTAKEWVAANVPAGSRILVDSVGGGVSFLFGIRGSQEYRLQTIDWEDAGSPQSLKEKGFDYVVTANEDDKPGFARPLYGFIRQEFAVVREFRPAVPRPPRSLLYTPLFNPVVTVYRRGQGR